jgi:hypothetical protein
LAEGLGGLSTSLGLSPSGEAFIQNGWGLYRRDPKDGVWTEDESFRNKFEGGAPIQTTVLQVNTQNEEIILDEGWASFYKYGGPFAVIRRPEDGEWHSLPLEPYTNRLRTAMNYGDGSRIYFWTRHQYPNEIEMYRSGSEWDDFEEFPAGFLPKVAFIDPHDDFRLVALREDDLSVQLTTDGGLSWVSRSDGLSGEIFDLLMDPQDGNHLLIIYRDRSPWESFDGGITWSEFPIPVQGLVTASAWDPTTSNVFLASGQSGVVSSRWGPLNQGLPALWVASASADLCYSRKLNGLFLRGQGGTYLLLPGMRPMNEPAELEIENVPPWSSSRTEDALILIRPNPSQGTSVGVGFDSKGGSPTSIQFLDVRGRLVQELQSDGFNSGIRWINWDGKDRDGHAVAGGVYFVRVTSQGKSALSRFCIER